MPDKNIVKLTEKLASGRRRSWFKRVDSVDMDVIQAKGMYGFDGPFLKAGDNYLEDGVIVLWMDPVGSVKSNGKDYQYGMVLAGEISWVGTWNENQKLLLGQKVIEALEAARLQFESI